MQVLKNVLSKYDELFLAMYGKLTIYSLRKCDLRKCNVSEDQDIHVLLHGDDNNSKFKECKGNTEGKGKW